MQRKAQTEERRAWDALTLESAQTRWAYAQHLWEHEVNHYAAEPVPLRPCPDALVKRLTRS